MFQKRSPSLLTAPFSRFNPHRQRRKKKKKKISQSMSLPRCTLEYDDNLQLFVIHRITGDFIHPPTKPQALTRLAGPFFAFCHYRGGSRCEAFHFSFGGVLSILFYLIYFILILFSSVCLGSFFPPALSRFASGPGIELPAAFPEQADAPP